MVSRQSKTAVQVTVERKTRYTRLAKLKRKGAHEMIVALTRRLSHYPKSLCRSLTYDNGSENADHVRTNKVLGTKSWFCEPYHSWERSTGENTIGLVRRFFPKKTDLAKIPLAELKSIERWINNRPRKCLGFKTSSETFRAEGVALRG
jgi:IS30 family transposase